MLARATSAMLWVVLAALASGPAIADPRDQDAVREAVSRGEIRPLADLLAGIRERLPGEVVGVEVENKKGRWIYEVRVVDPQGRLFDAYVDARDGTIERVKEK